MYQLKVSTLQTIAISLSMNDDTSISEECDVARSRGQEGICVASGECRMRCVHYDGTVLTRKIAELAEVWLARIALIGGADVVGIEMLAGGIAAAVCGNWIFVDVVC